MNIIKSNQFQVTEGMQEAVYERFDFLTEEEFDHLRLSIETLSTHRLRIKAILQKSKQKPLVMEVLVDDFYKGIDQLAKKMKHTLKRQEEKTRRRHEKLNLGVAMNEIVQSEHEELLSQLTSVDVPVYQYTQQEALKQLDLSCHKLLMYQEKETGFICTLIKQEDGTIKQYTGVH